MIILTLPIEDSFYIAVNFIFQQVGICGSDIALYSWNAIAKQIATLPFIPGKKQKNTAYCEVGFNILPISILNQNKLLVCFLLQAMNPLVLLRPLEVRLKDWLWDRELPSKIISFATTATPAR